MQRIRWFSPFLMAALVALFALWLAESGVFAPPDDPAARDEATLRGFFARALSAGDANAVDPYVSNPALERAQVAADLARLESFIGPNHLFFLSGFTLSGQEGIGRGWLSCAPPASLATCLASFVIVADFDHAGRITRWWLQFAPLMPVSS